MVVNIIRQSLSGDISLSPSILKPPAKEAAVFDSANIVTFFQTPAIFVQKIFITLNILSQCGRIGYAAYMPASVGTRAIPAPN